MIFHLVRRRPAPPCLLSPFCSEPAARPPSPRVAKEPSPGTRRRPRAGSLAAAAGANPAAGAAGTRGGDGQCRAPG